MSGTEQPVRTKAEPIDIVNSEITAYAERHTTDESAVLKKINRETYSEVLNPVMLSGHLQGRFLAMISKMVRPVNVLEIGTFTGYSAICFAEGLQEGGRLITIDINEELRERVSGYFREAGVADKIDYRIGAAADIIPTLSDRFDLVFIDADKENYGLYYDLVIDKVNLGGLILADNVLWDGKVLQHGTDKRTVAIQKFNEKVKNDPRVECLLVTLRDGLMIARKVRE